MKGDVASLRVNAAVHCGCDGRGDLPPGSWWCVGPTRRTGNIGRAEGSALIRAPGSQVRSLRGADKASRTSRLNTIEIKVKILAGRRDHSDRGSACQECMGRAELPAAARKARRATI